MPIKSKLQRSLPPPPENLGHLTILCAWRVGNLPAKAFPGVLNLTLHGRVEEIEPEVSGFN